MRRWLALCAVLSVAGCAPTLSEGRYTCSDDQCPPGWFCHSDDVCRATPELVDAGPVGPDAARSRGSLLAPCTANADCESAECYRGGTRAWPTGYCSLRCSSNGECGALGAGASCDDIFESRCKIDCSELSTSCPEGFQCVGIFRDGDTFALGECFPIGAAIRPSGDRCAEDVDCPDADFNCIERRCHRPCAAGGGLPCAAGELCLPSMSNGEICTPGA